MHASAAVAQIEACSVCRVALEPHVPEVRDSITGQTFSISRCARCGVGTTVPVPARIEEYYSTRYYGHRHSFTTRFCAWRRRRMLAQSLRGGEPGQLLDVGSGEGEFLQAAGKDRWTTAGVELHGSPDRAGQRVFRSLREAAGCGPYRCITLWHVLEHVPDPLEHSRSLRSMLSADGILMVAVPDFGGLQARLFGRHWLHLDVPRHLHHFTRRGLMELLETAGFEVVRITHQELEYDWFGWIQSLLNTMFETPNVLFDSLTGKPRRVGRLQTGACYALATLLALPALALTLMSTAARRGGTLVVSARPRNQ